MNGMNSETMKEASINRIAKLPGPRDVGMMKNGTLWKETVAEQAA